MEAMEIFYEEKDIALVLLDVMMPKMDGWQTCREIRQSSQVPIIMLTARSEERDELQGFDLGVDEYISKPFSPKILVARVGAILRRVLMLWEVRMWKKQAGSCWINLHQVKIDGKEIELSFKNLNFWRILLTIRGLHYLEKRY